NEPASHGYVKFRVKQRLDNPIGTVISNQAAIYFDFNEPIITNDAFVTIGEVLYDVTTHSNNLFIPDAGIDLFPNPTRDLVSIHLKEPSIERGFLQLFNPQGQIVREHPFWGSSTQLDLSQLPKGMYWLKVRVGNQALGTSKLMVF
ncbi:MAG: T9SS type A sorting domain-containing protein, partial [Bacteroidota bacterium]